MTTQITAETNNTYEVRNYKSTVISGMQSVTNHSTTIDSFKITYTYNTSARRRTRGGDKEERRRRRGLRRIRDAVKKRGSRLGRALHAPPLNPPLCSDIF